MGQGGGRVLGYFQPDCWTAAGNVFSEVAMNLNRERSDREGPLAVDLLVTLIHELAHAYAHHMGIKDTSNRGRYHSMKFGRIAFALGLSIAKTGTYVGLSTPGLTREARELFSDVLRDLEDQITLRPHRPLPEVVSNEDDDEETASNSPTATASSQGSSASRYVSAACGCTIDGQRPRRIRVARGSWDVGPIVCGICRRPFTESLTIDGQAGESGPAGPVLAAPSAPALPTGSTLERKEGIIQQL